MTNDNHAPPVTVFRTNDLGLLMVARSLLDSAGIPYAVPGERLQGIFPGAHHGSQFTPGILVHAEDADDARALLKDLEEPGPHSR